MEQNLFYILMHKNLDVAEIEIDSHGKIINLVRIIRSSHFPFHHQNQKPVSQQSIISYLNNWWMSRCIPMTRPGIENLLKELKTDTPAVLLTRTLGLNISDQYWICPKDKKFCWEAINFHMNDFHHIEKSQNNQLSPDLSSSGMLPKRWTIQNGKRYLIKMGTPPYFQEPLNEAIASRILDKLNIPHVKYDLGYNGQFPFSRCESFTNSEIDYITEAIFMCEKLEDMPPDVSQYQYYIDCCKEVNIPDIQLKIDRMLIFDYLILNEDRHFNNFGLIRNADSLKYHDVAPLFDHGNSLCFQDEEHQFDAKIDICKPFECRHFEQIKYVTNIDWLDFNALDDSENDMRKVFQTSPFMSQERIDSICKKFKQRIELLKIFKIEKKKNPNFIPSNDVRFNPLNEDMEKLKESLSRS